MSLPVIALGGTHRFQFTTRDPLDSNQAATPASLALSVREEANDTFITAGVSVDVDIGTAPVVGFHEGSVVCSSANGYELGKAYASFISAGTVAAGAVSLIGEVVDKWRIETAQERAFRLAAEALYPSGVEITTVTGNNTTTINLTDVVDAQTPDNALIRLVLIVHRKSGTGEIEVVETTACSAKQATVQRIHGGAMSFSVAAGDVVFISGPSGLRPATAGSKLTTGNLDAAVSSRATQAQILSDATPFAGANVDAAVSSRADGASYTPTRAGYLDNLNVGGLVASAAGIAAITQAQRVRVLPPALMERPDAGSENYRIWIYAYNELHEAEDLDSNPTVTAENNTGVDRSVNLGTVTKPGATTGIYYVDYTVASGHAIEGLVFRVTATENAVPTEYAAASIVVDTTAVDFTSADRAKLDELHDVRITAARAANLDQITAARLAELDAANLPTDVSAASLRAALGLAAADLDAQLAAIAADASAILLDTGTDGVALSAAAVDSILDEVIEGSRTMRQMMRGFAAVLLSKASGLETTTAIYRNIDDTKDRVTATVTAEGNRTGVTLDLT